MKRAVRVLVVDDDAGLRALIARVLSRARYAVTSVADGAAALRHLRAMPAPDVVVCDVNMPGMDGFAVLEAVRQDAALAGLPFLFLTALSEHDALRRGMRLGADDFLAKPVRPRDLLEAVAVALDKRRRRRGLAALHANSRARGEARETERRRRQPAQALAELAGRTLTQTVLFSDIRGFTAMAERLSACEVAELLSGFLREACAPVFQERGQVMKIMGDGLMAVFGEDAPSELQRHAAAALRAGQGIVAAARKFRDWISRRFDLRGLPPFDVGVGIHTGEVMLSRMPVRGAADLTAVGDTVNVASRLEAMSKELRWPVVASLHTITLAGARFRCAERREICLAGRGGTIAVGRLLDTPAGSAGRMMSPLSSGTRAVLEARAHATAAAGKGRVKRRGPLEESAVEGYRLVHKLGESASSQVYVAVDRRNRREVVLEIPRGSPDPARSTFTA